MSTHACCSNLRRAVPPLARRHKVTAARHRAHPLLPVLPLLHRFARSEDQNDLRILTERLARINDNLARKITSRNSTTRRSGDGGCLLQGAATQSSVRQLWT